MQNTLHHVIAFTGKKGHGKDTAAAPILMIRNEHTMQRVWHQVNFADPVKSVCDMVFNLTADELYDPLLKGVKLNRWPFESPRFIMQKVGTELFRYQWPEVWLHAWQREVTLRGYRNVVVTDLRFPNEFDYIKQHWGTIVRIERPGVSDSNDHMSETLQDDLPVNNTIINDGTIEQLERRVLEIPVVKETIE